MPGSNTNQDALALLTRGAAGIYSLDDLKTRLASGARLRVKLGLDPTAPDIHLGHSVVLRKMRQFQDLGHKAVLIVGDYTARIGDPTGRNTTRPVLSEEQIRRNAATYVAQASKILDTHADRLELRFNGEWLAKLSFADVLRLTGQMTVQQMLHRDSFRQRMNDAQEIAITEFLYPLMQAYDSVEIKADIELGGTDQTFNNLCGRDLMPAYGLLPQIVIVMPILVGLDGVEKMSKSKGNYIGVSESADEMFGKLMSIPDTLMPNYFELLTNVPKGQVEILLDHSRHSPRDTKDLLARNVVSQYWGEVAGDLAAAEACDLLLAGEHIGCKFARFYRKLHIVINEGTGVCSHRDPSERHHTKDARCNLRDLHGKVFYRHIGTVMPIFYLFKLSSVNWRATAMRSGRAKPDEADES